MNIKDLSGQRFGRLVAISRTGHKKGSCWLWLCRCDCGREIMVSTTFLARGLRKSCGCLADEPRSDLTGHRFGRLTVVGPTGQRRKGGYIWLCRCDCGGTATASTHSLTSGTRRSCGCLHTEQATDVVGTARAANHVDGTNLGAIRHADRIHRNNSSGVRGVSWHSRLKRWQARITFRGRTIHLGYYENLADAAAARKAGEERYFGEYLRGR